MCDTNTLNLILMELRNIKTLMQKQPTFHISIQDNKYVDTDWITHTVIEPIPEGHLKCGECNEVYFPSRKGQKYCLQCGGAARQKAYRRRKKLEKQNRANEQKEKPESSKPDSLPKNTPPENCKVCDGSWTLSGIKFSDGRFDCENCPNNNIFTKIGQAIILDCYGPRRNPESSEEKEKP